LLDHWIIRKCGILRICYLCAQSVCLLQLFVLLTHFLKLPAIPKKFLDLRQWNEPKNLRNCDLWKKNICVPSFIISLILYIILNSFQIRIASLWFNPIFFYHFFSDTLMFRVAVLTVLSVGRILVA
jgi:hypothetical protein